MDSQSCGELPSACGTSALAQQESLALAGHLTLLPHLWGRGAPRCMGKGGCTGRRQAAVGVSLVLVSRPRTSRSGNLSLSRRMDRCTKPSALNASSPVGVFRCSGVCIARAWHHAGSPGALHRTLKGVSACKV